MTVHFTKCFFVLFYFFIFSLLEDIYRQKSEYEIRRSILWGPVNLFFLFLYICRSTMHSRDKCYSMKMGILQQKNCFIVHCFWSSNFIITKINKFLAVCFSRTFTTKCYLIYRIYRNITIFQNRFGLLRDVSIFP